MRRMPHQGGGQLTSWSMPQPWKVPKTSYDVDFQGERLACSIGFRPSSLEIVHFSELASTRSSGDGSWCEKGTALLRARCAGISPATVSRDLPADEIKGQSDGTSAPLTLLRIASVDPSIPLSSKREVAAGGRLCPGLPRTMWLGH